MTTNSGKIKTSPITQRNIFLLKKPKQLRRTSRTLLNESLNICRLFVTRSLRKKRKKAVFALNRRKKSTFPSKLISTTMRNFQLKVSNCC
uniref:Uncharacterized protein n=1 Tax=Romanomermis culicivorax TaxID=13658 RepID=A0A915HTY1_ROMCU